MALFRIEKGLSGDLATNRPHTVEGYCYVTTDDGKFYIDTATADNTSNRIVLNAGTADKTKGSLTLQTEDGEVLGTFNGEEDATITVGGGGGLSEPIILSENISYGSTLPTSGVEEGQLFFLEEADLSLPIGGEAGQVLIKNSETDGDATWSSNINGNAATASRLQAAKAINGISFDGSSTISNYGVCSTAASTAAKEVTINGFSLVTGAQITVKFTNHNSAYNPTLNVNGTGAKPLVEYGTKAMSVGTTTNGWSAGAVLILTYDGTSWVRSYSYNSTYYYPDVLCVTAAATAAKTGTCSYYSLDYNRYIYIMVGQSNTYQGALTLNINSQGAKPIYINGAASSASNYTLPAGMYLVYCNGVNYYFRTDGGIQGGTFFGTASNATKATQDGNGKVISSTYLPLTGGTITGNVVINNSDANINKAVTSSQYWQGRDRAIVKQTSTGSGYFPTISMQTTEGSYDIGTYQGNLRFTYVSDIIHAGQNNTVEGGTLTAKIYMTPEGDIYGNKVYGAVWNDYAEYRITKEEIEPGRCVTENGDDTLSLSTARLQRGCEIVSDTFGFAIGETEESKTPIAVSGRVLAYPYESREEFAQHIGWPVCSGPKGTVSIMTEEEEEKYPSRIIGTISAVPDYETWGSGNISVKGRIWIKVK